MGIKIDKGVIIIGKEKIPLISGEFHYWRNNKSHWKDILKSIQNMGLKIISSYVPWNYHQVTPGKYDFKGETEKERDLEGFINLVEQEGFYLILRPGPYIYSEWPCGGPTEEAIKYHRLHPEFLKLTEEYLKNVCNIIKPHQITKAGNVILVQVDNEPYPVLESYGAQFGVYGNKGLFSEWLKNKYKDIKKLNLLWHTEYKKFEDACIYYHEAPIDTGKRMADRLLPFAKYYIRYKDTMEFILWYSVEIIEKISKLYRKFGIDVPLYSNCWSYFTQDFKGLSETVDFVGLDCYPSKYINSNKVVADEWLANIDNIKEMKNEVGYVWSAEFQSGLYPLELVGYLPPQHFAYVPFAMMGYGLCGWNWYMLVERDNWYRCPINEWGRTTDYFNVHKEVVDVTNRVKPWEFSEELTDISILNYKPHRLISPGNWEKVFYSLQDCDLDVLFYNPELKEKPKTKFLIYAGAEWMDRESQQLIYSWVKEGGTLIAFNCFPQKDENSKDLSLFGFLEPDGIRPVNLPVTFIYKDKKILLENAGHLDCKVNFFYYREIKGEPIRIILSTEAKEILVDVGLNQENKFIFGYELKIGKGRIIHIGSNPDRTLIDLLVDSLNIKWFVRSRTENILTTIHKRKDDSFILFVNNRSDSVKPADIELQTDALGFLGIEEYKMEELTNYCKEKPVILKGKGFDKVSFTLSGNQVRIYRIC